MKKILLATSALATAGLLASPALAQQETQEGSAMMAMSDESTISIFQEFGYTSASSYRNADGKDVERDSMFFDGELIFGFASTSDSGLRYSTHAELEVNPGQAANGIDEASVSLGTAEFGTITLGANDDVSSTFATYLPGGRNTPHGDDWIADVIDARGNAVSNVFASATGANYSDNVKVAYRSPSYAGLSVGGSISILDSVEYQAGGDTGEDADIAFGARYSTEFAGASIDLQFSDVTNGEGGDNERSNQHYGANVTFDRVSFAASSNNAISKTPAVAAVAAVADDPATPVHEGANAVAAVPASSADTTTNGYGIGFDINDDVSIAAALLNSEDDVSGDQLDTTVLSLSYTIAPGLNFAVALNQYSYDNADDNDLDFDSDEVRASIQVNF